MGSAAELPSVQLAAQRCEKLRNKVRTEKGRWLPNAWELIEECLKDEAQFMHECDVSATCTYVFYVEIACMYFTVCHQPKQFKRFMQIALADMAKFGASATVADDSEFSVYNQWILGTAIQMFGLAVTELRVLYPDTP